FLAVDWLGHWHRGTCLCGFETPAASAVLPTSMRPTAKVRAMACNSKAAALDERSVEIATCSR
ncbi:MAG: hypothetical protein ABWZ86_07165, partial [Hyphomicrobium sp.]